MATVIDEAHLYFLPDRFFAEGWLTRAGPPPEAVLERASPARPQLPAAEVSELMKSKSNDRSKPEGHMIHTMLLFGVANSPTITVSHHNDLPRLALAR